MVFKKYINVENFPKKEMTKITTVLKIPFVSSVFKPLYSVENIFQYNLYWPSHEISKGSPAPVVVELD